MKQASMLGLFVAVTFASTAGADPPFLKGAYGFTGSETCLYSDQQFNDKFQVPPTANPRTYSFVVEGIQAFQGDGTGTVKVSATVVNTGPLNAMGSNPPSANSNNYSYSFTYAVNGDGSWTSFVPGTINGTFLAGPRAGQTFTVTGYPTLTGLISADAKTLTAATVDPAGKLAPAAEIITYHPSGSFDYRICLRSRTFIHLSSGP
jgi:hypothetical protein